MDKAQEREAAAMAQLKERATRFAANRRKLLRLDDQAAAELEADVLSLLETAYFKGNSNGRDDEQEYHKAIGGCRR